MVGGPGLRRGRRDPETVGYGEALDFWRVVGFERDRRLALRAEMKVPGEALLEFRVEALNDRQCVLHQSALFRPRGLFGLAYWYSVLRFARVHHKPQPEILSDGLQLLLVTRPLHLPVSVPHFSGWLTHARQSGASAIHAFGVIEAIAIQVA